MGLSPHLGLGGTWVEYTSWFRRDVGLHPHLGLGGKWV